jgi:hypothetical protein
MSDKIQINPHHKRTPIEQARFIAGTLGVYTAAKYLRNRGWSEEAAMYILLGK